MLAALVVRSLLVGPSTAASRSLGLTQALALARLQAPSVVAAEARVRQAKAVVDERAAAWHPTLSLPMGYVYNDQGRFVSLNGPDEYTLQAAVHVPIFDPAGAAAYRSAVALLNRSKFEVQQVDRSVDLTVLGAFFTVLQDQQALGVQEAGLKTFQDEASAAQKRFGQGVSSKLDVDRARFAVAGQEAAVRASETAVETAHRHLGSLVGIPMATAIVVPPVKTQLATGDLAIVAQDRRPEVEAALANLQAAREDREAAELSRHWPAIGPDLLAGWDANGPPAAVPDQPGWSAGVSITVPLYSGGAGAAQVQEARQVEDVRKADLAALLRSIDLALGDDRAAARSAADQARLAAGRVHLAQEELRMTHFGYEQGSVPLIEVLRTEQAAIKATADLASARLNLELARYRLTWDMGIDLP